MRAYLLPVLVFIGILLVVSTPSPCAPLTYQEPTQGSHGYRTWYSTQLRSQEHTGASLCTPEGWEPIGAVQVRDSSAVFETSSTAVFIHTDSFIKEELAIPESSYRITLRMPKDTSEEDQDAYKTMVRNAFARTGALFNDSSNLPSRTHTVLVTAELGFIDTEEGSIYPDPGPEVSYIILPPSDTRSEELLIHAVAHLYNRFQDDGLSYQESQSPIPPSDWQELEASWTETAFHSSPAQRRARFEYMYQLHEKNTSSIGVIAQNDATYADVQYAHYILAPLVMIGVDGLLPSETNVETLLTELHKNPSQNFMNTVRNILSPNEYTKVESWVHGTAKIPRDTLLKGLARYD